LAENIKGEAATLSEVPVPQPLASEVDVTEDAAVDEYMVMELEDELPATVSVPVEDNEEGDK
jgi:hypothetical protein